MTDKLLPRYELRNGNELWSVIGTNAVFSQIVTSEVATAINTRAEVKHDDALREALHKARVSGVRVIVNDNGVWDGQKHQGMHTNGPAVICWTPLPWPAFSKGFMRLPCGTDRSL